MFPKLTSVLLAGCAALALLLTPAFAHAQRRQPPQTQPQPAQPALDPGVYNQLRYRCVGPVGNRVTSAVGIPGDPSTY
jgi:hypothetical protein